jgi:hypothetical protein
MGVMKTTFFILGYETASDFPAPFILFHMVLLCEVNIFYYGIALFVEYELYKNILLSRLIPYADEIIGDHQCGF